MYVCVCVCVYTCESVPLNSTWHKQQSLCKKGTIFVKRNIHAFVSRLVALKIPVLAPWEKQGQGSFRETRRGRGKMQSAGNRSFARGHFFRCLYFAYLFHFRADFSVLRGTDLSVEMV